MSLYPPPPPGWDSNKLVTEGVPESRGDEQLARWAATRGYGFNASPDVAWYQGWAPFVFLFKPERVLREVRASLGDSQTMIIEALDNENERYVISFLLSSKVHYRCAIRSRMQKDALDELRHKVNPKLTPRSSGRWRWRERDQMLRRTYGRGVRGVIGDAIFEAHCEIQTPSREEGLAALPPKLREWLINTGWRGILEQRPGGLVAMTYGPPLFDPASLDATVHHLDYVYKTLTT